MPLPGLPPPSIRWMGSDCPLYIWLSEVLFTKNRENIPKAGPVTQTARFPRIFSRISKLIDVKQCFEGIKVISKNLKEELKRERERDRD